MKKNKSLFTKAICIFTVIAFCCIFSSCKEEEKEETPYMGTDPTVLWSTDYTGYYVLYEEVIDIDGDSRCPDGYRLPNEKDMERTIKTWAFVNGNSDRSLQATSRNFWIMNSIFDTDGLDSAPSGAVYFTQTIGPDEDQDQEGPAIIWAEDGGYFLLFEHKLFEHREAANDHFSIRADVRCVKK